MESQPPQSSFVTLLGKTILPKVQIIGLIVGVIGVIFKIQDYSGASDLLTISLSILAGCYFLLAFMVVQLPPTTKPSVYSLILYKVIYIACSVTIIGILFALLKLEGVDQMLLMGAAILGVASLAAGALILSNNDNLIVLKRPLISGVALLIIGLYFLKSLSVI